MVYLKSNSICCLSRYSCSRMYLRICSSFNPTVLTLYHRTQKCFPIPNAPNSRCNRIALLPFKNPIAFATLYLGGILMHAWIWSGIAWPSMILRSPCLHSSRIISPALRRTLPNNTFFRYFGTQTIWYLHSHFTCDKLCQSLIIFLLPDIPLGALGKEILSRLTGGAY